MEKNSKNVIPNTGWTYFHQVFQTIPFHLLLGILGLYVFRFGYAYGYSDQDEFLPYLMHLLDPSLFTTDWFVETQLKAFSIRAYFVFLLLGPAALISIPFSVGLLYLVSWFATATGLYKLALHISSNRTASILSVAIALVITPFWTLGGNDLVHSMLVPSMLGWSLGIWGLLFFAQSRVLLSAFTIGIATLFQALVGLQLGLILGTVMITELISKRNRPLKDIFRFGLMYVLSASPALIPLFYQQFTSISPTIGAYFTHTPSLFYIMAEFRNPHHYLFHSFNPLRVTQFAMLGLVGIVSIYVNTHRVKGFPSFLITSILGIITLLCLTAYFGTEVSPNITVAKLQLFKTTVLAKVLLIIAICTAISSLPSLKVRIAFERILFDYPRRFLLLFVMGYVLLIAVQSTRFESKVYPFSLASNNAAPVYDWVSENTSKTAVFAAPPSWSGFRISTQRSIVINHKAFPYKDLDNRTWFNRLHSMAPFDSTARKGPELLAELDNAYENLPEEGIASAIDLYGIDYLIRSTALDSTYPLLFSTDDWFVYAARRQGQDQKIHEP